MATTTPLSYSVSAASLESFAKPKDPPPPPSTLKISADANASELLSLEGDDGSTSSLLKDISPQQQRENVQDLLQYIDNMTFSPYFKPKQQDNKSLGLARATKKLRDATNQTIPSSPLLKHNHNIYSKMTGISPETPIRPTHSTPAYQSFLHRQDPVGNTPVKAKENHIHNDSFYIAHQEKEEPIGNSPIVANEAHFFEASRYYPHDDNDDDDSELAKQNIENILSPIRPRSSLQDPPLEKSMDDAWSIVLGSTIIEEEDDESSSSNEEQRHPTTPIQRSLQELPESVRTPEDAKLLLKTAVTTLQDARAERENARRWAQSMKQSVSEWVSEQQTFLHRSESNLSSDHTKSLANLESSIQKMYSELVQSNLDRTKKEDALYSLVQKQQDTIRCLSIDLTNMKTYLQPKETKKQDTPVPTNARRMASRGRKSSSTSQASTTSSTASGRIKKRLANGGHVVMYGNGVQKEVHKDGTLVVRFNNGDVETKFPNGTCAYFHSSEKVMQITQANGSTLFEYPNRQIERHYANGSKAILFADGTRQRIDTNGNVETAFATART
jgi:centromere protein J